MSKLLIRKIEKAIADIDFTPPKGVQLEAAKGLEWRREFNRGGTSIGVARGRDLSNGTNVSPRTVRRMKAYFGRHEKDKEAEGFRQGEDGFPSAGRIAWALWGGDLGRSWANGIVEQLDAGGKTATLLLRKANPNHGPDGRFTTDGGGGGGSGGSGGSGSGSGSGGGGGGARVVSDETATALRASSYKARLASQDASDLSSRAAKDSGTSVPQSVAIARTLGNEAASKAEAGNWAGAKEAHTRAAGRHDEAASSHNRVALAQRSKPSKDAVSAHRNAASLHRSSAAAIQNAQGNTHPSNAPRNVAPSSPRQSVGTMDGLASGSHVHYKNLCPACLASSQCRCASSYKRFSAKVCPACYDLIANRPLDLSTITQSQKSAHALMGKMVTFEVEGVRIVGRVEKQVSADNFSMKLAMPDADGMLILTDSEIIHPVSGLEAVGAVASEKKMRMFEDTVPFEIERGKMHTLRNSEKAIIDYQDVTIMGFASTFKSVTPVDRDGDYVLDKAFDKTLMEFRKNPVMLIDHQNRVDSLVGSYSKIATSENGLAVEGTLSNAPEVRRVRFLVAEGHLKAFSIGGFFLYEQDGKGIGEVKLYEISLIPIPANPDSLFNTRSLGMGDVVKCWNNHRKNLRAWIR